jgi:hypothetical protein
MTLDFYQKHWKKADKAKTYAQQAPPRVEPRLQEIYRKFASKMSEYKHEIGVSFNVYDKFDPDFVRHKLAGKQEYAEFKAKVEEEVDQEIAAHMQAKVAHDQMITEQVS